MSSHLLAAALLTGRPYAGAALRALQGDPERQRCFRPVVDLVAKNHAQPLRILEVGSWAGVSALSWAAAAKDIGRPARLTCVDFWRPYFDSATDGDAVYREMNAAHEDDLIFLLFQHNLRTAGLLEHTDIRRGDAREVLPRLPEHSFDIIYIDAGHRLEDVTFDITEACRLIRPGGIIAGDDLELRANGELGDEHAKLLAEGKDFAYSAAHDIWYHPGVTQAVASRFGDVFAWNGFWAVQMTGDGPVAPKLDAEIGPLPPHVEAARDREAIIALGQIGRWRFFRVADRVFGVGNAAFASLIGALDAGRLGAWPDLIVGRTVEEIVGQIEESSGPGAHGEPALIGEYNGFNLVRVPDGFLALSKALGQVDIDTDGATLAQRLGFGNAFFAATVGEVLLFVHVASTAAQVTALRAGQIDLANKIHALSDSVRDAAIALQRAISGRQQPSSDQAGPTK